MTKLPFNPKFAVSKKKKPTYSVMDLNDLEHHVEVDWDSELVSEDEAYACINLIWSTNEDRELMENEIHPDSMRRLQETLDDRANETAHDDWYEIQASRAYDRAKDRIKYGD